MFQKFNVSKLTSTDSSGFSLSLILITVNREPVMDVTLTRINRSRKIKANKIATRCQSLKNYTDISNAHMNGQADS